MTTFEASGEDETDVGTVGRADPSTVLFAEQLTASTEWVVSGRLRLRRRIVSERRTIEVVVRREELVIDGMDVAVDATGRFYRGTTLVGSPVASPHPLSEPFVASLREEVPEVVMHTRVYEHIRADTLTVGETAQLADTRRYEAVDTDVSDGEA